LIISSALRRSFRVRNGAAFLRQTLYAMPRAPKRIREQELSVVRSGYGFVTLRGGWGRKSIADDQGIFTSRRIRIGPMNTNDNQSRMRAARAYNRRNYGARSMEPASGVRSRLQSAFKFRGERAPLVTYQMAAQIQRARRPQELSSLHGFARRSSASGRENSNLQRPSALVE